MPKMGTHEDSRYGAIEDGCRHLSVFVTLCSLMH